MANRSHQKRTPKGQISKTQRSKINLPKIFKTRNKIEEIKEVIPAMRWLIWGGAVITLLVGFPLNDPFNAPKSWALSISAFWLLGWLGFNFKHYTQDRVLKQATLLSAIFVITLAAAFLATDNKFVGFFGDLDCDDSGEYHCFHRGNYLRW